MRHPLLNWFFYGHFQIALAATGLGWVSVRRAGVTEEFSDLFPILAFLFLSTLGVYTLHRLLSFRRAGERPQSQRYNLVAVHPGTSLGIGAVSIIAASIIGLSFLPVIWPVLLWAVPLTVFYLTPPLPGWRRLRDIPYLKSVWVALSWTLMTHILPIRILTENNPDLLNEYIYYQELIARLLFTGSIAILFDFRDIVLDHSQGVKTIAGQYPKIARIVVTLAMVLNIILISGVIKMNIVYPVLSSLVYGAVVVTAWLTNQRRSEAWYAVVVNGLLLGPTVAMLLLAVADTA